MAYVQTGTESTFTAKYGNPHSTIPREQDKPATMFVNSENTTPVFRGSVYLIVSFFDVCFLM